MVLVSEAFPHAAHLFWMRMITDFFSLYLPAWGSPLVFAIIWTLATLHWVRRSLRNEKLYWADNKG